jgi:diguanylate cyclase (GGDEF)-like protein
VERLLEDSWEGRGAGMGRRELLVESAAAIVFLACAVPLAASALASHHFDAGLAAQLVVLYALASRLIKFPIGAGYFVPSYIVLVPMLLLLPPGTVPLLVAAGLVLGTLGQAIAGQIAPGRLLLSIPDAWHSLGPAAVLLLAAGTGGGPDIALVYLAAFAAGCLLDLASATFRESAILGIPSVLQLRVIALVWLIDACVAPLGFLVARAARGSSEDVLLILPLYALLLMMTRDRNTRIEEAQRRLELVARERSRLQTAVQRLGEALAAKLDLDALTDIVLRGSIEALDADAGCLRLSGPREPLFIETPPTPQVLPTLLEAADAAQAGNGPYQLERSGVWAIALPFSFDSESGRARGAIALARDGRAFRSDEQAVLQGLVERARRAAADIVAHQLLREQAYTDTLTRLGNRRKLAADVEDRLRRASSAEPLALVLYDLDGFKAYNDAFGHLAGDALLARLGAKLATAVTVYGSAYRLGGDEFCVLVKAASQNLDTVMAAAAAALVEHGENFSIGASHGSVTLPDEADSIDHALQMADQRMYVQKRGRPSQAADQARDVLIGIVAAKAPALGEHCGAVAQLCLGVGRALGMSGEQLDELFRAAELHDIGKVGLPDGILEKPGPLSEGEWEFMRQHTVLGERILSAAPALRPVARIVRSTDEHWDGRGYPDGLRGEEIPLAARIIAACNAYETMIRERPHAPGRDCGAAREELRRQSGHQFDPRVVRALLSELG